MKFKMDEDSNRQRIHYMRRNHADNVEHSKKSIFDGNCSDQKQIKI
jgi:hypothetical protein